MKAGIPGLKRFVSKDDPGSSFDVLLDEMLWFMDFFREKLCLFEDYNETSDEVSHLYHINVTYDSLEDGLVSNIKSEVNHALDELSDLFYKNNFQKELISLVVNRVLFQSSTAWEEALSYTAAWLSHENGKIIIEGLKDQLLGILRKYKSQQVEDSEPSFVEEQLVKIAFSMHDLEYNDAIIDYWIMRASTSRFNNLKRLVFERGVND